MDDEIFEVSNGDYLISTDKNRLEIDTIYTFLHQTYWGKKRTKAVQYRAIQHSLCFGVYKKSKQIGFGRLITDYTTFAYIVDFFILPPHQRQGIGTWLLITIFTTSSLKHIKHWSLTTRDAQGFYKRIKFDHLKHPSRALEFRMDL